MAVIKTETFHEAWDCDGCGTTGLSAYNCKQCPDCGAPLDDESVYRTFTKVENYSFKGHDINCAHCGTRNEKRFSCRNCGASLSDDENKRVEGFTYKSDSDKSPVQRQKTTASTSQPTSLSNQDANSIVATRKWWWIGGGVAFLVLMVGLWVFSQFNAVIPITLTADKAHWEYHLSLEDFEPRQKTLTVEDGSFGSPPSDAYHVDGHRVFVRLEPIYSTRNVPKTCTGSSSDSNGDGTWTRTTYGYDCSYSEQVHVGDRDIWGTHYNYVVDRWESVAPLTKDGWVQKTDFPEFSTPDICLSAHPTYGCVRATNEPKLTFTIHFSYHKKGEQKATKVSRTMPQSIWEDIHLDTDYPAVLNGFGGIRAIQMIDIEYEKLMGDK